MRVRYGSSSSEDRGGWSPEYLEFERQWRVCKDRFDTVHADHDALVERLGGTHSDERDASFRALMHAYRETIDVIDRGRKLAKDYTNFPFHLRRTLMVAADRLWTDEENRIRRAMLLADFAR